MPGAKTVATVRFKPIYMDSIDNSEYVLGRAKHSARRSWVYIDGENFLAARADVAGDPNNPDLNIAWKYMWTAKDTWLGSEQPLGGIGAVYNLTMDPFEKYDMTFNGATPARLPHPRRVSTLGKTTAGSQRSSSRP